jgi:hypothetical protein
MRRRCSHLNRLSSRAQSGAAVDRRPGELKMRVDMTKKSCRAPYLLRQIPMRPIDSVGAQALPARSPAVSDRSPDR